jgi:hypothetical protein
MWIDGRFAIGRSWADLDRAAIQDVRSLGGGWSVAAFLLDQPPRWWPARQKLNARRRRFGRILPLILPARANRHVMIGRILVLAQNGDRA